MPTLTLRLTAHFTFETNGVSEHELTESLYEVISMAVVRGTVTGDTDAELIAWDAETVPMDMDE